ncbi:MAG: hypothetical protein ACI3VN_06850 [Candidatus Onthomonas sp.]
MEEEKKPFTYTYSAQQREEIEHIRKKYLPPEEDKMARLRRLDESASRPGRIVSILVGTVSTLVFGFGMSCTMVWAEYFVPGIVIGLIGMAGMACALPLNRVITARRRKKLAPEILRLSQELMEEQ